MSLGPSILVVDNYDSFVYNLVQYLGELGARVTVRRNDDVSASDLAALGVDGVLISPGPGRPATAGNISPSCASAASSRCRCSGCASVTRHSAKPSAGESTWRRSYCTVEPAWSLTTGRESLPGWRTLSWWGGTTRWWCSKTPCRTCWK